MNLIRKRQKFRENQNKKGDFEKNQKKKKGRFERIKCLQIAPIQYHLKIENEKIEICLGLQFWVKKAQ